MKQEEKTAARYLANLGYCNVVYEPDGKVPPDFSIDDRIAVEVRRLNQNHEAEGRTKGLEQDSKPLWDRMSKLVRKLGPMPANENWYVSFSFRRPYGPRRTIERQARSILQDFIASEERAPTQWRVSPYFKLEVLRSDVRRSTFFTMAGYIDHDEGGWVLSELERNLNICVAEKSRKRANAKRIYPEWWLILIDHIDYGVSDLDDRGQLKGMVPTWVEWDKIILLNPLDASKGFVLQETLATGDLS